jgi:hypothetical protein
MAPIKEIQILDRLEEKEMANFLWLPDVAKIVVW